MSFEDTAAAQEPVGQPGQEGSDHKAKASKRRRSVKRCTFSQTGGNPETRIDPFFIFWPIVLHAKRPRHVLYDWQVICTSNKQLFLIGRSGGGCDFSTPLIGLSYDSLSAIDDEDDHYFMRGKPKLRDDLADWHFYCSIAGVNPEGSIDVTPQVWRLYQALNGKLKKQA